MEVAGIGGGGHARTQCKKYATGLRNVNPALKIRNYSTLGMRSGDLQARVYKQERRNLTLHEAQPSVKFRTAVRWCHVNETHVVQFDQSEH